MRILVISDTHGNIDEVVHILDNVEKGKIDMILHCGDYVTDARIIEKKYPNIDVSYVYGNCDTGFGGSNYEVIEADGINIFMTHGHRYGVKWGEYEDVAIDAKSLDCDIAICGHSHIAHVGSSDDIWTLNPGSITLPRDSKCPSYATIDIEDGELESITLWQVKEDGNVTYHTSNNDI